ncbi:hypothetical protein KZC56_17455 [Microbacterium sp. SSW1-47]|uniref:hypothetical protein n=1 Tax=Microbacterium sufflavum TaxID=2851649 RepID=UPI001FFD7D56|nr:hypothetical protein [Microbacterium sufflavum]MCK2028087.1 hypothetical protein [Microbacterium sufflavum]
MPQGIRPAWGFDDILDGIGDWFTDALRNTVSALIQGVSEAVKWVSTYFLYLPAPVLEGEGAGYSPAERVQAYTDWAVIIGGMIGMAFALIMVARRKDADSAVDVFMGFFRVILVTGAGIPTISLLAKFFDQASPWLINNIGGGTFEDGSGTLVGVDAAAASSMGVGTLVLMLVSLVFGVLGGILNLFMVMFNWGVLPVVAGLLPVLAAAAMSERGRNGFNRVLAWTAAILLFKPVAAVIYGVGIASGRMITGGVEDAGQIVLQSIYGTVLLCAAGIALPAIARIVAPAIAAGTQGGGAGLLIGAGMVAAGAVTGGAAAVAAAGARGAGVAAGAGKAATSDAPAPSGASSTAGTKGGASSGPSGAGSGSGSGPSGAGSDGGSSSGGGGASGGGGSAGGGGGGGAAPSGAGPSGGAPATRGSQWAKRWAANGAYQTQAQIGAMEQAVEAGDER